MILTGKDKVKAILTLLGSNGKAVLAHVSPELTDYLMADIEDTPKLSEAQWDSLSNEAISQIETDSVELLPPIVAPSDYTEGPAGTVDPTDVAVSDPVPDPIDFVDQPPADPVGIFRGQKNIADKLANEKPQIIAYLLSKMDPDQARAIMDYFDPEFRREVDNVSVAALPFSARIHQRILDYVMKGSEGHGVN